MRRWGDFSTLFPIRRCTILWVPHACFSGRTVPLHLEFQDPWNGGQAVLLFFFFFRLGYRIIEFYLFIYLWLCWVFVSVRGLSLVVASGGHSSSRCAGLSLSWPLLLRNTGSRRAGSVIVAHGPSCSAACGIFPDQGLNPCPLHWQADSQPLRHQGSPVLLLSGYICWPILTNSLSPTSVQP